MSGVLDFAQHKLQAMVRGWNQFWFAPIDLYNVAFVRMCLALTWLAMYTTRFLDFSSIYSDSAVVHGSLGQLILPAAYTSPFPFALATEALTYSAHIAYLILLVGLALGLFSRSLTWLVFVLHLGFMQKNFSVVYGADLFSNFWLLYLSFINHNRYFSVKNFWRKQISDRINLPRLDADVVSTVFVRMMQIQLCICYGFTGIEKLKGSLWWEGVAVWHVLGMKDLMSMDLTFLQNFPVLIGAMTIATVLFEIYFPIAVWIRPVRPWWLLIGLGFHGMTAVFMNLPYFCLVMVTLYLLYIDSKSLRFFISRYLPARLKPVG